MKHKTRVAAAVVGGLIAAGAGAGLAFADLSGSISLTNTNISFSGSYQYNVYWDSISTGVKVSGTLKSAKTDSGYLNGRQQGYGWTRLGYVDIGKSVAVSKLIGPGDTRYAKDLRVSVCTDRWYWDSCTEKLYPR